MAYSMNTVTELSGASDERHRQSREYRQKPHSTTIKNNEKERSIISNATGRK